MSLPISRFRLTAQWPPLWPLAIVVAFSTFPALAQSGSRDRADIEVQLRTLAAAGDHDALADLLEEWLADHPADVEAHLRLGRAYADGGHAGRAEIAWRRMLELNPGKPDLYLNANQNARRADLFDVAIRLLIDGRRQLRSPATRFSWQLSDLYLQTGDWPAAITAIVDYVRQQPNRYTLAENRLLVPARNARDAAGEGGSASGSSRAAGVLAALESAAAEAIEASPDGEDPLPVTMLLSSFSVEVGQPRIGLAALTSIAHLPDAAALVFQFGSRCEAAGDDDVAAEAYALYARHSGNTPYRFRSMLRQAAIEERSGRFDAAVETYRSLATRFPRRPEALEALSRIGRLQLRAQGDAAAARTTLEALLEAGVSDKTRTETLALLAECDLRQDDLDRAAQRLEELVDGSSALESRLGLAEIAFFSGDFDTAVAHLDCLLTQPQHALANDALELLLVIEDHRWQPEALRVHARARLRERQNRHREAAADWRWLAQHVSGELLEDSLLAQAQLREDDGSLDEAMTLYLQLAADFPEGRHGLEAGLGQARILESRGRRTAALKVYETSLLRYPEDAHAPQVRLEIQRLRAQIASPRG